MRNTFNQYKILAVLCLLGLLALFFTKPGCQAQITPRDTKPIIVTGRVLIEQRGGSPRLILHAADAAAYLIKGELSGRLLQIAQKKPGINLVTVTGVASGASSLSCNRTSSVVDTEASGKKLQTEIRCIRYMHLEVDAIISVAESNQPMPPLKRDGPAELKMMSEAAGKPPAPPDIGEIYGTITGYNFRSAINTIDIQNNDKKSPLRSITVLITAGTRIVKRINDTDTTSLTPDSLKTGQQVTVVYSKQDIRANAMFITVTKE